MSIHHSHSLKGSPSNDWTSADLVLFLFVYQMMTTISTMRKRMPTSRAAPTAPPTAGRTLDWVGFAAANASESVITTHCLSDEE